MITSSKSLREFRSAFDQMKLAPFINKETGEPFKSLAFIKDGKITLVGFSSKLGELSASEIKAEADNLRVCQLESGSFKLCKAGEDTWETVEL